MKHRIAVVCLLLVAATVLATAWMLPGLPPSVAVHWNSHGVADRYGSRAGLLLLPLLMAVLLALLGVLPRIAPQRFDIGRFRPTWWFAGLAVLALLAWTQALLLAAAGGAGIDMARASTAGLALLFVLLGNVMGKVKRNFWLGIRTPWTLASERVWYATHRLAGKSMTLAGLAGLLMVACKAPPVAVTGTLVAGAVLPAAWSLVYYRRLAQRGGLGEG